MVVHVLLVLSLLLKSVVDSQVIESCVDHKYFFYECSQLAKYCTYPQAFRIRRSCPITCGLCTDSPPQVKKAQDLQPVVPVGDRSVWMQRAKGQLDKRQFTQRPIVTITKPRVPPPIPRVTSFPAPRRTVFVSTPSIPVNRQPQNTRPFTRITRPATTSVFLAPSTLPTSVVTSPPSTTVSLTLNDEQADVALLQCCKRNNISPFCEPLCSYKTSKSEILSRAVSGSCTIDDAKLWVKCASGGKQNAECCKKNRVKKCDKMCNGQFPASFNELLSCVNNHLLKILQCHRDNITPQSIANVAAP